MSNLTFATLNARGLKATKKRRAVFRQMRNQKKYQIIFLQETHSVPTSEKIWNTEWGRKIYFSHGTSQSRGVAILLHPKLNATVEDEYRSNDGRIMLIRINIEESIYVCVNVYAPNDPSALITFFQRLYGI